MSRRRVEHYKEPPMPTSIRVQLRMKSGDEYRVRGKRVMRGMLILKGDEDFHPEKDGDFYIEFVDVNMRYHRSGVPAPKVQAYSWEELKEYIPQLRCVVISNKTVNKFLVEHGFEVEEPKKETVSLHATVDISLLRMLEEETDRRNATNNNPDKKIYLGNVVSDILCQYFEKGSDDKDVKGVVKEAVSEALAEYFKK